MVEAWVTMTMYGQLELHYQEPNESDDGGLWESEDNSIDLKDPHIRERFKGLTFGDGPVKVYLEIHIA